MTESCQLPDRNLPSVSARQVSENLKNVHIIDVRRSEEFNADLGHIPGATLSTLGPDLTAHLATLSPQQNYVFVCRSGGRSSEATKQALAAGLKNSQNMIGGMSAWNHEGLPVERT